jgi:hypothetical protein
MTEYYLVTATGIKDKKPYSSLSRIVQGTKENGDRYSFIDDKTFPRKEAEELQLGAIITYESKRVTTPAK